jgi:hypothetical protein
MWFSSAENHENVFRLGLHLLRNRYGFPLAYMPKVGTAGPSTTLRFGREDKSERQRKVLSPGKICHPEPERTRVSCHAALAIAACAAFIKESRMMFAEPTNLDRKSGVA